MDVEELKRRSRENWGKGEYSGLSELLRPAAVALMDACAVSAGQEVLDVAAGDGNFAIACADEGASVVASDLAPGMVDRGRRRSDAGDYDIEWVEADAEDLPFEDGRFECVGSVFGAMIAPRPRRVAEELFRVARVGNTVGMTAWMPKGANYDMFTLMRRYAPPEEDLPKPEEWSDRATVEARFDGLANSLEVEERSLPWHADSPEDFVATMEVHSPMHAATREAMQADEYARLREEFVGTVRDWTGGDGAFEVDAHYALIVARRRG